MINEYLYTNYIIDLISIIRESLFPILYNNPVNPTLLFYATDRRV